MQPNSRARRPSRLPWAAALLVLAIASMISSGPAHAEETRATVRVAVGASAVIALKENPSTGYRWRLNAGASRNLSLVDISDAGSARDSNLIGAPGQRRFSIAARQAGSAIAVFDYARPWEHVAPAQRHVVTIEITGR
jgi:inhibitor of cysteine peptidase